MLNINTVFYKYTIFMQITQVHRYQVWSRQDLDQLKLQCVLYLGFCRRRQEEEEKGGERERRCNQRVIWLPQGWATIYIPLLNKVKQLQKKVPHDYINYIDTPKHDIINYIKAPRHTIGSTRLLIGSQKIPDFLGWSI